jgi:Amt family ammonium transporter
VGTIGIGLLASAVAPNGVDGLFYGGGPDQLGRQTVAALATFTYSFVATYLVALVLDRLVGFRVDREHEVSGVDLVIHAETAYDLHSTSGARPHAGSLIHPPHN